MMQQPSDAPKILYSDAFNLSLSAWGAGFQFMAKSQDSKGQMATYLQALINMSLEHLKAMCFIMCREILRYERATGIEVKLPSEVLTSIKTNSMEWQRFWYGWTRGEKADFGPPTLSSSDSQKSPDEADKKLPSPISEFPFPNA